MAMNQNDPLKDEAEKRAEWRGEDEQAEGRGRAPASGDEDRLDDDGGGAAPPLPTGRVMPPD